MANTKQTTNTIQAQTKKHNQQSNTNETKETTQAPKQANKQSK